MRGYRPHIEQPADPTIRHIPLTQGQVAIVDAADYEWLMQWKWAARRDGRTFYALRHSDDNHRVIIKMHAQILPPKPGFQADHINRNGIDNRRVNLRYATFSQQGINRRSHKQFKGVRRSSGAKTYQARLVINGRLTSVGTAATPEDAARLYDAAAQLHYGEFAYLNFPPELYP